MVKTRKYIVKNIFQGVPKIDDFEIIEVELGALKVNEVLVKNEFLSVDPYQRSFNGTQNVPYDQFGYTVGVVQESKNPQFPVGTRVVSHKGWCEYYIEEADTKVIDPTKQVYKIPNLQGLSPSLGIGAVGMPGVSAYFGFLKICRPKAGETVVVTSAAGAVGSLVGQIAKIKGCKVIGFTGSDEKVHWLEKELGFDKAFNYKTVNVLKVLKEAAPNGVDCYFDNVGGEISSLIMSEMNMYGRVSVCGSISCYNGDLNKLPAATILQPSMLFNQLRVEGFISWRWLDQWDKAFDELITWIKNGQIKVREHVTEGFDNVYNAFVGMLAGENMGKAVVRI